MSMDVGTITTAIQWIVKLVNYVASVRHAPADRELLIRECQYLVTVFTGMKDQAEEAEKAPGNSHYTALANLTMQGGPIDQMNAVLVELAAYANPTRDTNDISMKDRLTWHFKKSDIKKLEDKVNEVLIQYQAALTSASVNFTTHLLKLIIGRTEEDENRNIESWVLDDVEYGRLLSRFDDASELLHHETCTWFLDSSELREWIASQNSVLVCKGLFGAGKTVLTARIIGYLDDQFRYSNFAVAYLYCRSDDVSDKATHSLKASLLRMMIRQSRDLPNAVRTTYDALSQKALRKISGELREKLILASMKSSAAVFLIVDGLDECDPRVRRDLLQLLSRTQDDEGNCVRIFITGTEFDENLGHYFQRKPPKVFNFRSQGRDIGAWVEDQMSRSRLECNIDTALRDRVRRMIIEKANGLFLPVRSLYKELVPTDLIEPKTLEQNLKDLEPLPVYQAYAGIGQYPERTVEGYGKLYHRVMATIQAQGDTIAAAAFTILSILANTLAPVTAEFLRSAVVDFPATKQAIPSFQDVLDRLDDLVVVKQQRGEAKLENSKVKTWLLGNLGLYYPKTANKLTDLCVQVLLDTQPDELADLSLDPANIFMREQPQNSSKSPLSLHSYVLRFWSQHVILSGEDGYTSKIERIFQNDRIVKILSSELEARDRYRLLRCGKAIHVLAGLNLSIALGRLLNSDLSSARLNARDYERNTPLLWALQTGALETARLLLSQPAVDVTAANSKNRTALHYAAEAGLADVIELILARESSLIDRLSGNSETPLFLAAINGEAEAVGKLLKAGANVNRKGGSYELPILTAAVLSGGSKVVRQLLAQRSTAVSISHGVVAISSTAVGMPSTEVDIPGPYGLTPLAYACQAGNADMAKILIEESTADVNARSYAQRTPLSYAAESGSEPLVAFLLKQDAVTADIDAPDRDGRTPLSYAAEHGFTPILRMLLTPRPSPSRGGGLIESGLPVVDIDSKCKTTARTPLGYAIRGRHDEAIRLLLTRGAGPGLVKDSGLSISTDPIPQSTGLRAPE